MKKMSMVCMIVIYLAMQGFSSTPQYPLETYVDWYTDEMAGKARAGFLRSQCGVVSAVAGEMIPETVHGVEFHLSIVRCPRI